MLEPTKGWTLAVAAVAAAASRRVVCPARNHVKSGLQRKVAVVEAVAKDVKRDVAQEVVTRVGIILTAIVAAAVVAVVVAVVAAVIAT